MFVNERFHLSYCTNIHPGQDWQTTFDSLKEHIPKIKQDLSPLAPFGLGLRLSNQASFELGQNDQILIFKNWLTEHNCYIYTMNGFPYGNFHGETVKDKVHLPDWTSEDRLAYTTRLFEQMALLIPPGQEGGISTSPLSYKPWCTNEKDRQSVLSDASRQLAKLALFLNKLNRQTGNYLHLDLEPEPDGFLENTSDVLDFYKNYLLPIGSGIIMSGSGMTREQAEELILKHICICYDICHFSLAYEEPEYTFESWSSAGIRIGKIQISAALKILSADDPERLWNSLSYFDEPTYLHQVTQKVNNQVITYRDLPELLKIKPEFEELRAHFHVPVFLDSFGNLFSTQDHILKVLSYIDRHHVTSHLEVETYTWDVLPSDLKSEINSSITRELRWVLNELKS
ncbi:MAG: metabolite traffic protein EboE [Flavobacteriaceae bacterium]